MASSDRPKLVVEERPECGSRAVRRLRREGYVPGVVYGGGNGDSTPFKVGARDLRTALLGGSAVLDLSINGGTELPVIVKDQQHHPVRDEILHLDLLQVRLDEKIQSTVAVELEGVEEAPGAKEGGVLEHVTRELNIEALPTDIPERVVVDVSHMEAAATMHLSEISPPPGVVFLDDPKQQRHAIAKEAGTTVLAIGGEPGVHTISSWEYIFPSLPARNSGDWDTARAILEEALAERDIPAIRYHLACVEARAGNADRALEELRIACEARPDYAPLASEEDDLASLRDDPRFPS